MKVFISSTFLDLQDYRRAAIEAVNRQQGQPLAMEFFGAQPIYREIRNRLGEANCIKSRGDVHKMLGKAANSFSCPPSGKGYEACQKMRTPFRTLHSVPIVEIPHC